MPHLAALAALLSLLRTLGLDMASLSTVVADGAQHAIRVCVGQNAALGVVGRVRLHREGQIRLEVQQKTYSCGAQLL